MTELAFPEVPNDILQVFHLLKKNGGRGLIVGGWVRDAILGIQNKDVDIESYGIPAEKLRKILIPYNVNEVGKSFGVFKINIGGMEIDVSLPRSEEKQGVGHRGFIVNSNENLSTKEAFARRDFTINAIGYDPLSGEIIDHYGGIKDCEAKILRHTSPAFAEDPLRVLRAVSFAARFGFDISPPTSQLCEGLLTEFHTISAERRAAEFEKFIVKGVDYEKGFQVLQKTGWVNGALGELKSSAFWSREKPYFIFHEMSQTPQDPEHHPEGDALTHTVFCLNALKRSKEWKELSKTEQKIVACAMVLHDIGKPKTTFSESDYDKGRQVVKSPGHAELGGTVAQEFALEFGLTKKEAQKAERLVTLHMEHINMHSVSSKRKFVMELADRAHPANLSLLTLVMRCDKSGRPSCEEDKNRLRGDCEIQLKSSKNIDEIESLSKELGCFLGKPERLMGGNDISKHPINGSEDFILNGFQGPEIGIILSTLYEAQKKGLHLKREGKNEKEQINTYWQENWTNILPKVSPAFKPVLNGHDCMKMGLEGKEIGHVLSHVLEAQYSKKLTDRESALAFARKYIETNTPMEQTEQPARKMHENPIHPTHLEQNKLMARQRLMREFGYREEWANEEKNPEKRLQALREKKPSR